MNAAAQTLRLDIANLTPEERQMIGSVVALFTDPALAKTRRAFMSGFLIMSCEDGQPTWTGFMAPPLHGQN